MRLSIGLGAAAAFAVGVAWFTGSMPGHSARGAWTELELDEADLARTLEEHVVALSADCALRHTEAGQAEAAVRLRRRLQRAGWEVNENGTDLWCTRTGLGREKDEIMVLARYDAPQRSPGAATWASSAAVALELAVLHVDEPCERSLTFVYTTGNDGAARAIERSRAQGRTTIAVLTIGPLGHFGGDYEARPIALAPFVPSQADHVLFVADWRGRDALRAAIGAFRDRAALPSEGVALPWTMGMRALTDLDTLGAAGTQAVWVSDGGAWRDRDCGGLGDVADKLDYGRMARAVLGLQGSLHALTLRATLP